MTLKPGGEIDDRYQLTRLIGAGSMGQVWEARDHHTPSSRRVALKIHHLGHAAKRLERRLERELDVLASLSHPNIVTFYDWGQTGDYTYFAMELLHGMDLAGRLQNGPLDPIYALRICRKVADAAAMAHRSSPCIVHRDIKPSNIFLARYGDSAQEHVKLLDFGIAKPVASGKLSTDGGMIGTPHFMPPEHAVPRGNGPPPLDPRYDVYSIGATLYACLAGQPMYHGSAVFFHAIYHGPAPSIGSVRPDLAPEIVALVDKAVSYDASARYADARALHDALGDTLDALRPSRSSTPGTPALVRELSPRGVRHSSGTIARVVLIGLAGLVALAAVCATMFGRAR